MVAALALAAIGAISMLPNGSGEEDCGIAKPELSEAASTPGVAGVVERYVVISNPMPWGNSAAVVTRVWGDIDVSRWSLSDRRFEDCSWNPVRESGSYVYDFPTRSGEIRHDLAAVSSKTAAQNELVGEWTSQFSGYQAFEIGFVDRILGWIRVFPESIVIAGLLFFWLSWKLAPRKVDVFGR